MVPSNDNVTGGTMDSDDKMNIEERFKYLRKMKERYVKANRKEKSLLLTEMQAVTGLHRGSLKRRMCSPGPQRKKRRVQRGRRYDHRVDDAIRVVGESLDWICAERLQPALARTAKLLASFGEIRVEDDTLKLLESISISTVYRVVKRVRQDEYLLPRRKGRRQPNSVIADIPVGRIPWDIQEPGHVETDTVHHCGSKVCGDYVCTLQFVDITTLWSERYAIMGRSQRETVKAFKIIEQRCPFPLLEVHPDNGSEFMNDHIKRYFRERAPGVHLSRSRPWKKNDNRFVEEKNSTLVRAYLGDMRLDTPQQCRLLNQIYQDMWLYYNFFQPVLRQIEKTIVDDGSGIYRCRRKHDVAKTPLQRLLDSQILTDEKRAYLLDLYQRTNPRELRRRIYQQLHQLYSTVP
jgi:hypothetical protein